MRYSLSSLFQIGKFGEICEINIITKHRQRLRVIRVGLRHVGALSRLIIWCFLKPIFFKLLPCWTGLVNLFEGTTINYGLIIGEILSHGET
jgi:hypothetical protein